MTDEPTTREYGATYYLQTVDRAVSVLNLLRTHPGGLTITQIANQLELPRTVIYRIIATLEDHRLVSRAAPNNNLCQLGPALIPLGRTAYHLLPLEQRVNTTPTGAPQQ